MKIETIGLLGFGRFGRMAYHYLRQDKRLKVYDVVPERLEGIPEGVPFEEAVASPLILLCVPISAMEEACRKMAPLLQAGQIVVDTCSVKKRPVEWMRQLLPPFVHILGTHPLFGPDSGKDGIAGLKIALCPARIEPEAYAAVRRYLENQQLILIEADPEEHDRQVAKSQAIFHLIAQTLKRLGWVGQRISTPGPESFFRLAKTVQQDTEQLFRDMEQQNPYAAEYRREFIQELMEIDRELAKQNK